MRDRDEPIIKEKPKKSSAKKMKTRLAIFLIFAVLVLIGVPYYIFAQMGEDGFTLQTYRYAEVGTRTFVRSFSSSGNIKPSQEEIVISEQRGYIEDLNFDSGSFVEKDEVLGYLYAEDKEDELKDAEETLRDVQLNLQEMKVARDIDLMDYGNQLNQFELRLERAEAELEFAEQKFEHGDIAEFELREARNDLEFVRTEMKGYKMRRTVEEERTAYDIERAEDRLREAENRYEELKSLIEGAEIRAPISGKILDLFIDEGEYVEKGSELFEIVDMSNPEIILEISEDNVASLYQGQKTEVKSSNIDLSGEISYISPRIKQTGDGPAVEVHILLKDVPEQVRPWASASVSFETEKREEVAYLPRGPYLTSGEYSFVYVLNTDKAYRRSVSFGQHDGGFIEVRSGLEPGDRIIAGSYEEFKEHREIEINPEGGLNID